MKPALVFIGVLLSVAPMAAKGQSYQQSVDLSQVWVGVIYLLIGLGIIFLYFLPTFFAFRREHPNRWPIFLINLVFGGTGLGWIGSLIWALNAVHRPRQGSQGGESGLNIFANDVQRVRIEPQEYPRQAPRNPWAPEPPFGSPPLTDGTLNLDDTPAKLQRLKALYDAGGLDEDEYQRMRQPLLDSYLNR